MQRLKRKLPSLSRSVVIISFVGLLFVFYKSKTVLNGKGFNEDMFGDPIENREEQLKPKIASIENDDGQTDKPIATRNFNSAIENRINIKKEEVSSALSKLNIFDSQRYESVQHNDIQAPGTCVQSGLQVQVH